MPIATVTDLEKLSPALRGRPGLVRALMHLTGVDKLNALYDRVLPLTGPAFAEGALRDIGVDYRIGHPERLQTLPDGPFITISNHAYGHLDGIILVDLMGHLRPGYKVMVNEMLGLIEAMRENFVVVNPTLTERRAATATSISGVRTVLRSIEEGLPVGFFPSGAVSDYKFGEGIRDRAWQEPALKLIRRAHVPIVPIRFFDRNSAFYYSLGLIDYRVRLARLCHELFNKRGNVVRIGIGPVISVEAQDAADDYGALLRSAVYGMPLPETFSLRSQLSL